LFYPSTPFTRLALEICPAPTVDKTVDEALELLKEAGIVGFETSDLVAMRLHDGYRKLSTELHADHGGDLERRRSVLRDLAILCGV
jgi:hypothetical protein